MLNNVTCFWLSLLCLGGVGCGHASQPGNGNGDTASHRLIPVSGQTFFKAYRMETADTVYRDTVWLHLYASDSDTVHGTYDWLVPGKDGKKGTVEGLLTGDAFFGLYRYQQEGGQYTDSIRISFPAGSAVVTQLQASGVPLTDTLRSFE